MTATQPGASAPRGRHAADRPVDSVEKQDTRAARGRHALAIDADPDD